jgi:hypothetical protein
MRTKTRRHWSKLALAVLLMTGLGNTASMSAANVMCLKTNTGQYIEVVRVSMMVVPDGGSTFEIVVKEGTGATGVESISFEKHESDIDLSKYQGDAPESTAIDMTKPVFMLTNTGKYFYMKDLPVMTAKEGSSKFDLKVGATTESDVELVYFYRGPAENVENVLSGIDEERITGQEEQLTLQSPINSQMQISGCGNATKAVVFAANGQKVAEAVVADGAVTISVGHLTNGVYIVKVGNKTLKFNVSSTKI